MNRSPRLQPEQKPTARAVKSPLTICLSPVRAEKINKPVSKQTSCVGDGAGKVKHVRTRSQKEGSCLAENVFISEEIKSQLKFEVAVSLSTEYSGVKNDSKVVKMKTQNTPAERKVLKMVNQNSPALALAEKNETGVRQIKKKPIPVCPPSMSIDKTPQNLKNIKATAGNTPTGKTKSKARAAELKGESKERVQQLPKSSKMPGEKRKRAEVESPMVFSPLAKKRSAESPQIAVTPHNSSAATGDKTPKTGVPSRHRSTPDRKSKGSTMTNPSASRQTPKKTGDNSQTRSPAFLKRHIHQSPRPDGCLSPKRKPGTPWRECQLRKLAEEQKAAKESMKQNKEKKGNVSTGTPPPTKMQTTPEQTEENMSATISTQSPVKKQLKAGPEEMEEGAADADRDTGMVPAATSPPGSDVDQKQTCTESVDSSSQTVPSKTVLSRFRSKLTQSYTRTVEYFQEVKHIWDGNC